MLAVIVQQMIKLYSFSPFFVTILFALTSCSHSIKIDIRRQTSELNHCENIFGNDLNSLKYENAILLQTGVVDTTDEQVPIPIAIIIVDKKEIVLKLTSRNEIANEITRAYEGEGYKLKLNYNKNITEHNETIFKGKFFIEYKSMKSEYEIEGTTCIL
jgi:hypothetical protein